MSQKDGPDDGERPDIGMKVERHCIELISGLGCRGIGIHTRVVQCRGCDQRIIHQSHLCAFQFTRCASRRGGFRVMVD